MAFRLRRLPFFGFVDGQQVNNGPAPVGPPNSPHDGAPVDGASIQGADARAARRQKRHHPPRQGQLHAAGHRAVPQAADRSGVETRRRPHRPRAGRRLHICRARHRV